ncbi:MAG: hypothetical protein ABIJ27_07925 [Candidatus Omnitrophota bacterium]
MNNCCIMKICANEVNQLYLYFIQVSAISAAVLFGVWLAWKPRKAIAMQIAFYRMINWKLEPVSMEKEIRNTRVMGAALLLAGIASAVYLVVR